MVAHKKPADDHYVHIHTSAGKSMQLLKLRDAIAMMGIEPLPAIQFAWATTLSMMAGQRQ